jgi:hypothetical protein
LAPVTIATSMVPKTPNRMIDQAMTEASTVPMIA